MDESVGKTRETPPLENQHGRNTSQHDYENGDFGSVVPTFQQRYLREFPTNLDETRNHS
jgi:hypothetical protein